MASIKLSDKFGYKKQLLFTLPTIGMMIWTSLYTVVDGFFVSNFAGVSAFAGMNLIWPFVAILATIGLMFGTGGSAIVAKTFGEGDGDKANSYFSLFVYASIVGGIIFAILGYIFVPHIATLLGAEGELLANAITYGRILALVLPFTILSYFFQAFFVTAEKPQLGLIVMLLSGCTNIILDALLVMSLPHEYKLAGAAVATAIAEMLGGLIPLIYFSRKNDSILKLGHTKLEWRVLGKGCVNGSSEFMANIAMSVVGMLYNYQLMLYAGENGVAAYGVIMYVAYVFAAIFMGYAMGIAPVISYNFGAKRHLELTGLFKRSLKIVGIFGIVMLFLAQTLAYPFSCIFVSYDSTLLEMTISGYRIYSIAFIFFGFSIFSSAFFTALNDGVTSAIISFFRTLVFETVCVLVLPQIFGLNGIWSSIIVAEIFAVILSIAFLIAKKNKFHYWEAS